MSESRSRQLLRTASYQPIPIRAAELHCESRSDGSFILTTDYTLEKTPRSIVHLFSERVREFSRQPFIAKRATLPHGYRGEWQTINYQNTEQQARAVAQALINRGCGPDTAVMVISGPAIEHAVLMLGAFMARVPYAPLSTGYSLLSDDYAKLRHAFDVCQPRIIFADDGSLYEAALRSLPLNGIEVVTVTPTRHLRTTPFTDLLNTQPTAAVDTSINAITDNTHARTIFTSGSTGMSKGVIHTHGMLVADIVQHDAMYLKNEERSTAEGTTSDDKADTLLSWLPWSHVGGANNFSLVINAGATLFIDEGRPVAGDVNETLRNLHDIALTHFPSPPALFGFLLDAMENDSHFRDFFFSKLQLIIYGGASLTQDLLERLQLQAITATGYRIPITTKYGSTETMGITQAPWPLETAGHIGIPNAGVTLKLAPVGDHFEVRVKGPCVTPGYLCNPQATAKAFDEEGFYCTGDAARLVDVDNPAKGLKFDGRVVENFKLSNGSWVGVGQLRNALIEALGVIHDCVIAGHDRNDVRVLAWLRNTEAASIANLPADTPTNELIRAPAVLEHLKKNLQKYNANAGGSTRQVRGLLLMQMPPTGEEIADKGYINQRACLQRRNTLVEILYQASTDNIIFEPTQ